MSEVLLHVNILLEEICFVPLFRLPVLFYDKDLEDYFYQKMAQWPKEINEYYDYIFSLNILHHFAFSFFIPPWCLALKPLKDICKTIKHDVFARDTSEKFYKAFWRFSFSSLCWFSTIHNDIYSHKREVKWNGLFIDYSFVYLLDLKLFCTCSFGNVPLYLELLVLSFFLLICWIMNIRPWTKPPDKPGS